VGADRPINADVPASPSGAPEASPEPKASKDARAPSKPAPPGPPPPKPKRQRRPPPLTPVLLGLLVLVALAFIGAAVLGGSGGGGGASSAAKAPGPQLTSPEQSSQPPPAAETSEQLGYPAFATNNTTRIGGADSAANAAAVALAVFPSAAASQRPAAVTLVGEDDWAGGIAASVLMAEPVRAPVLVSAPGEAPEATAAALSALSPRGAKTTDGAAAFAIGDVAAPAGRVTRIKAGDAAAEAARIAALRDRLFGSAPAHVVVASSSDPRFAMPAAAWAARSGDPVLFAGPDSLPPPTARQLERHRKLPVYVLGPTTAISAKALGEIHKIDRNVKRVAGKDPVATALALARYSDASFGWSINDPGHGFVLASDENPLDAAAAAPLSASGTWGPLLLTDDAATLPAEVRTYLLDVKPGYTTNPTRAFYNHVWAIGDQEAISVNQQAEVNQLAELAKIGGGGE
jgi:hypothetical protein